VVLSDRSIQEELEAGRLVIEPRDPGAIQPASVDLRLGRQLRVFQSHRLQVIDVKQEMAHLTELVEIDEVNPFVLHPGEFVLGVTLEEVRLPKDIVGRLDGKSSLGRLGLVVHSTAGFVDPGWRGRLTLELSNLATLPINLYYGMKISQISFIRLTTPALRPYGSRSLGSKYQGQMEPTPRRFFEDFPRSPGASGVREKPPLETAQALRQWLAQSQFQGSVSRFAGALGVNLKTVENWVYGRTRPSRRHWGKLYELAGLPQFRITQLDLPPTEP
jgi:dCTP deaminase